MRPVRLLTSFIVAASVLLVLSPTGVSARKHASPRGCQVNINVAPRVITSGDAVVVFGRLRCTGQRRRTGIGPVSISLLERVAGTRGFTLLQTATSDARGFYEFTPFALQLNSSFYVRAGGAVSGRRSVRVGPQV